MFFFFLRIDTSLLRAACRTLASVVRLANHVKFRCGESRKFDWCCEIPPETGAPCGSRFQSKRALRCYSVAEHVTWSWKSDAGFPECHHQLLSMVSFYILNHTDSTETHCRFNVVWTLSGGRGWTRVHFVVSLSIDASSARGNAMENVLMVEDAK